MIRASPGARPYREMLGEVVLKHFEGHGTFMGTIIEYDEQTGFRIQAATRTHLPLGLGGGKCALGSKWLLVSQSLSLYACILSPRSHLRRQFDDGDTEDVSLRKPHRARTLDSQTPGRTLD